MKSLAFSLVVSSAAGFTGWEFFQYVYEPLAVGVVVALLVVWFRFRGLKSGLPAPYGDGKVSVIDERAAMRSGILIVLGGFVSVVGLMGSVFFVPPELYFAILIGVILGLPLSVAVFFAFVAVVEARSRSKIFLVVEETKKDERTVLVKTVEMAPRT